RGVEAFHLFCDARDGRSVEYVDAQRRRARACPARAARVELGGRRPRRRRRATRPEPNYSQSPDAQAGDYSASVVSIIHGMELHGQALLDYMNGDEEAHYVLRRDDGIAYPTIYAKRFFYPEGLPELDRIAVECCAGKVLDLGAGAGSHSLAIQDRGLDVTSVDISEKAVEVMSRRGCKNARGGDIFDRYSETFDTALVILNIGIVRNLGGLARFLKHLD